MQSSLPRAKAHCVEPKKGADDDEKILSKLILIENLLEFNSQEIGEFQASLQLKNSMFPVYFRLLFILHPCCNLWIEEETSKSLNWMWFTIYGCSDDIAEKRE